MIEPEYREMPPGTDWRHVGQWFPDTYCSWCGTHFLNIPEVHAAHTAFHLRIGDTGPIEPNPLWAARIFPAYITPTPPLPSPETNQAQSDTCHPEDVEQAQAGPEAPETPH